MSVGWYHKSNLFNWAQGSEGLAVHLPPRDYPTLHHAVAHNRLSRVALGVLKILFEHDAIEPKTPFTRAIKKQELAARLNCASGAISDAVNRINRLVVEGAAEGTLARQWGLIWRNDCGVGIHPGLGDLESAKLISEKQIQGQTRTWSQNKRIAEESPGVDEKAEIMRQIDRMTPDQRRAMLHSVTQSAAAPQKA